MTIFSFSLFSWSAAHATPFTQLLSEIQKRNLATNENDKRNGKETVSSVSALKGKNHPPNFHKVQLSSQDPHEWRRSTFTEAALTCTQLETRSVSRVFSISRKQAAKSKSQQKKVIVKVPSYTKVIVIIIVAVFPGSKRRFFNPNRFFPVVARFLPPFSPHLTWFWVMKCDRLLAQQLGRITSSG